MREASDSAEPLVGQYEQYHLLGVWFREGHPNSASFLEPGKARQQTEWAAEMRFTNRANAANGLTLRQGGLDWILGKNPLLAEWSGTGTRLLRAVGESPSLEGFKTHVDVALGDTV